MNRLTRLLELDGRLHDEIAAERRRLARIATTRDQVNRASDAVLDAIPAREIRAWAKRNDVPIPTTGRIPRSVRAHYLESTQEVTL